ncbi:MAG TPA: hypothetical protein VJX92_05915 [Methylomirabilota bacterium]|nr:hypothetical protein [Methylomirabilota bacterium]
MITRTAASTGRDTTRSDFPPGSLGFDWVMSVLCGVFLGGLFLDGWAHTHGRVDNTFFTPWHAVLYSGYLLVALFLIATTGWNRRRGHPWLRALPAGYDWSLVGVLLWIPGGLADMLWHEVFGFEASVDALLSPPHLVLALGYGLMASGPLRAAWRRPDRWSGRFSRLLPALLSLTLLLSLITFFTQIAHPIANLWGHGMGPSSRGLASVAAELGVTGLLLEAMILMGAILLLVRRFVLPFGALTVMMGVNGALMGVLYEHGDYPIAQVLATAAAGLIADLLLRLLKPGGRVLRLRFFAFAVPTVLYLFYFVTLRLVDGLWWTIHLSAGSIVLAGILGWLLSYVAVPPAEPDGAAPAPSAYHAR